MNLGDIWSRVQVIFGDTGQTQILQTWITQWANDGQLDIARKAECLIGTQTLTVVAGQSPYTLAADFIKDRRVTVGGKKVFRTSIEQLDQDIPHRDRNTTNRSEPYLYYVDGNQLTLYPPPVAGITNGLVISYIRAPAALVLNTDIPEIPTMFHEDIVRYCLVRAAEHDENGQLALRFQADYDARLSQTLYDSAVTSADTYGAVRALPGDDW